MNNIDNTIESEDFFNLCQTYRHARLEDLKGTIAAYQALIDYIDQRSQLSNQQWIPISESTPPDNEKVLIYRGSSGYGQHLIQTNTAWRGGVFTLESNHHPVTHWMPLPSPPST